MQGENERQGKVKSEREGVRHFFHKKKKGFWKSRVVVVQKNGKEMYKKCAARAKLFLC